MVTDKDTIPKVDNKVIEDIELIEEDVLPFKIFSDSTTTIIKPVQKYLENGGDYLVLYR